jgi:hypothetical protein
MGILGAAPRYRAYLLRCWAEHGPAAPAPAVWRYSLEDPHTGERRGFADLAALLGFLRAELALGCDDPPGGAAPAGESHRS